LISTDRRPDRYRRHCGRGGHRRRFVDRLNVGGIAEVTNEIDLPEIIHDSTGSMASPL
jgi:hypothetical protein